MVPGWAVDRGTPSLLLLSLAPAVPCACPLRSLLVGERPVLLLAALAFLWDACTPPAPLIGGNPCASCRHLCVCVRRSPCFLVMGVAARDQQNITKSVV